MSARRLASALPVHTINENSSSVAPRFLVGPIAEFGLGDAEGTPHRHEFVELVLVASGAGTHHVDLQAYEIGPPQVFLVAPGQVHHWEAREPIEGTLVLFREDFLAGSGGPPEHLASILDGEVMTPDARQLGRVERLLAAMRDEFASPDPSQEFALRNLLSLLLIECRRMARAPGPGRPAGLAHDYLRAIATHVDASRTVAEFAAQLCVTPGHLYEVVVTHTGRTPAELLREATLREAQRLLARTSLSCAQVASALGFEDASYFSRFFRREAGITPTGFRSVHDSAA